VLKEKIKLKQPNVTVLDFALPPVNQPQVLLSKRDVEGENQTERTGKGIFLK